MQPENIVLTERGGQTVKIIDFGTAMQLRKGEKVENNYNFVFCEWQIDKKNLILYNFLLSKVQAMVGTAEFVAPEVGLSLSLSLFVTIILQNMIFHSIFHKNIVLSLIILLNIVCFFTRLLFTKYGIILIFLNNCFHFVSFFLKQIEKKHILLQTWSMLHFCKSMWSYCLLIFAKTFFTIASELLSWSCILKLSNVYRLSCLSNDGNLTKVKL